MLVFLFAAIIDTVTDSENTRLRAIKGNSRGNGMRFQHASVVTENISAPSANYVILFCWAACWTICIHRASGAPFGEAILEIYFYIVASVVLVIIVLVFLIKLFHLFCKNINEYM